MKKLTKPRGTQDILPQESWKWLYIESVMRELVHRYGYLEIRLPTFESTEVFSRGVGETTDIVSKEMYTFLDKGDRSITLRPEGTAGVVRAVLENGLLASSPLPLKSYYIQSNFRYEKAQKGRLREFHQLGIECFATKAPEADAEVIALATDLLDAFQLLTFATLEINSIGCPVCRPAYHTLLREYFQSKEQDLCPTCKERLVKNPMRILDCKEEKCQQIAKGAPVMLQHLCEECHTHFEEVKHLLDAQKIQYIINPMIVRGLDYYTKTVFEFIASGIGTQGTLCAGGRYDGLVEELGGQPTPAIGFALGMERMLLLLEEKNLLPAPPQGPKAYIAGFGQQGREKAFALAAQLRKAGLFAECDIAQRSIKAQMKAAGRLGAQYTLVIGEQEAQTGFVNAKRMRDGEEVEIRLEQACAWLQSAEG